MVTKKKFTDNKKKTRFKNRMINKKKSPHMKEYIWLNHLAENLKTIRLIAQMMTIIIGNIYNDNNNNDYDYEEEIHSE